MTESTPVYIGKLIFDDFHSFIGRNALNLMDDNGQLYQWTVFLGNNNTGKTNLLKAIAALEATKEPPAHEESEIPTYYPIDLKLDMITAHSYHKNDNNEFIGAHIFVEPEKTNTNINEKQIELLLGDEDENSEMLAISEPIPIWGFRPSMMWQGHEASIMENFKIYGYGVTRRVSNNGISEKKEESNAASLFNSEHKLINIDEWLFQLDYASKNGQPAAGDRLQLLKEIIKSEILPEILDFRFITSEKLKNYIEYQTKEGWFLFDQLGYGYQATMSWVIDLCKKMFERYPNSPNPLKDPAIVLVDELDLHLHPKWQKTIVNYLSRTFTSTQFIVTTHSPLILQTIEKVNLFALIKTDEHVNIRHVPTESLEGWSVEEILREVMEMDEGVYSDKYNELYKEFDTALDKEDYDNAKIAYDKLFKILHPTSPERKLLKLQLSQIAPLNDKA